MSCVPRWLVLLALSACLQSHPLALPTDSTAGSAVFAIRGADARVRILRVREKQHPALRARR